MNKIAVFNRILDKITGVSLFIKVMGIALFLIILFGFATIVETRSLFKKTIKNEISEKQTAILRQMDYKLSELIVTGDLFDIYTLIEEISKIYSDIRYIIILNNQNHVIAHTFPHPLSSELISANQINSDGTPHIEILETEEGIITDIAYPIFGGKIGIIRLGITDNHLNMVINKLTENLAFGVLFVSLIGVIISYILAFTLNKPITNLLKGINQVRLGNMNIKINPWFKDEIGNLTEAFNEMIISLKHEYEMRRELMKKIITAQEEERQRISRELHDVTGQCLSSIKIGLKSIESCFSSPEAKLKLEEFRTLLNKSLDEIHTLSVELRPPLLSDFGVFKAIEDLVNKLSANFSIKTNYTVSNSLKNQRFSPILEIGIYRIVQEAISNIEKHSKATEVKINFEKEDNKLILSIEDNGIGFSYEYISLKKSGRSHIGLIGMKERAKILGGKLEIISAPQKGTKIIMEVPIER
jgi:signal transduction histidine kinase